MWRIVLLVPVLALLAGSLAAGSEPTVVDAAGAARLPDLRCFSVQGHCVPGKTPVGQSQESPDQIHNVLVAGWDPSAKVLRHSVWKHVAVSGDWVAAAKILPVPVHCDTYLIFVKDQAGVPQELWCIDGPRLLLLWEMLDPIHGRFWTRPDGSVGIVLFDGRNRTGTFFLNRTDEQHFTCVAGAAVDTDLAPGVEDVETALGPFDISTPRSRSATLTLLRKSGVLPGPDQVPDNVALPPSWIQEGYEAGRLSGHQPVSLFLLQGYWGDVTCPAGSDPEACTADALNRETVWLVRVGDESSGYERWMRQGRNQNTGKWDHPVTESIGTTASVVFEGSEPLLPAVPCHN